MRILRSIVAPSTAFMTFCDPKMTGCSSIRSEIIRDELVWDKAIFLQQLAHQLSVPACCVWFGRERQEFTLGVHGTPEVDQATVDLEIDLVECQVVCGFGRRLRRSAAILGPKWFTQRRTVS